MTVPARLTWYWHRFRAMDATEIMGRALQKVRLATVRSSGRTLRHFDLGKPDRSWPSLPGRMHAPNKLRERVRADASSIREGRWLLFGWKESLVPSPPVWHRDYAHELEAPVSDEVRQLNYRELPSGADARCIWETNRWAEMVRLAQNAWLNDELDDARLAQEWLLDWHVKNPSGAGINWTSSLEAAIRLINFCWIDALLRGCSIAELNSAQDELARQIVPGHALSIWRHRSLGSSANNHLLGELAGLALAARRWPSLGKITCSAERAWRDLVTDFLRQFADDGGNREQALHYHQFAWEMVWQVRLAMGPTQGGVDDRLRQSATFFCDLIHDRDPWDFGDSDEAQITPLPAARRTSAAEWKAWFLGQESGAALRFWLGEPPLRVPPLRQGAWKAFPMTGMAVWEANGWKARVDGSPLGFGSMAAHGHLDAMHVSLWDGEHALLVDPGTGAYFGNHELRTMLASWELHNGAIPVNGRRRPTRLGPFLWAHPHPVPQLFVEHDTCTVRFDCDGASPDVTRAIKYLADEDAWQISDLVAGKQSHVVRWRLAPQWRVLSQRGPEITLGRPTGEAVALSVESARLTRLEVGEGPVSPHFGDVSRGVVITVTFNERLVSLWQRTTRT